MLHTIALPREKRLAMLSLQKSVFSTAALPARDRLPAWRESIAVLFDVAPQPLKGKRRFNASLTSYLLGEQMMLSYCETHAQRFERGSLRVARDRLDHYLIQTHLSGSQVLKRGRTHTLCEAGDLMVIDLAERHSAVTSDFNNLSLVVPRHLLAPRLLEPDGQQGRVLKGSQALVRMGVNQLKTLWSLLPQLSPLESSLIMEPVLAQMASVLNGVPSEAAAGPGLSMSPLTRAKLGIEKSLQRNVPVVTLCQELNFSKATLYRLFEPHGGVRAYIQARRLRRCAEELLSPRHAQRRIYEIAYRWGFPSEAHFSRVFKQKFGISPSEARKLSAGNREAASRLPSDDAGDREYERWLLEQLKS